MGWWEYWDEKAVGVGVLEKVSWEGESSSQRIGPLKLRMGRSCAIVNSTFWGITVGVGGWGPMDDKIVG